MRYDFLTQLPDADPAETAEWRESLDAVVEVDGTARANRLLASVLHRADDLGVDLPPLVRTPYINSIPAVDEPPYPGDIKIEQSIRRMLRWNAMAMVTRANRRDGGVGGHISTYASSATLYEVAFNHFFTGRDYPGGGDQLFFQGHATPGIYARAHLAGRLTLDDLDRFRREVGGGGLSSYPHPWLMPNFWQFPTVSMGLGAMGAIYQARFNRYLHNRGLRDTSQSRVWAFLGDGECDEPETLGALTVASREGLGNLTFVVNCNLQRLDGPVRGNGKIIQELESVFRGAGWRVIKVIWGPEWDPLLAKDNDGLLVQRMNETLDGQYQKYSMETGTFIRENFFGANEGLRKLVESMSDVELKRLRRGGHSETKVYAAYHAAAQSIDVPTVVLCKTVKGYELGEGFEASNVTHQMKKLDLEHLKKFRDRLELPISDADLEEVPYINPSPKSPEVEYLREHRRALGGFVPERRVTQVSLQVPAADAYSEFLQGGKAGVEVSTTMAFVRLLRALMRDKGIGKHVVPIIPDEGRTFGMDAFFKEFGIYAPFGQKYTPVDANMLLKYHESQQGQLLEEGITEAGSMASFLASSTSYATHGVPTIPFYLFYSMFGFQRTGDQIWAVGDSRGRGFLLGATAGRTTLNGEGLQHGDGHSHFLANAVPNLLAYDPAFAYETAVIVRDGLRRMVGNNEDVFYYITLYNENYAMPAMPEGAEAGILRGMYLFKAAPHGKFKRHAQILASGPMMLAGLEAQSILAEKYDVAADVFSVTSYQQLYRDGRRAERFNRLNPLSQPKVPYVTQVLASGKGPVVTTSDWVQELPRLVGGFVPRRFVPLGANGYGRSDTREALRQHFEIDAASVVVATLYGLMQDGAVEPKVVAEAIKAFGIDPARVDPMEA